MKWADYCISKLSLNDRGFIDSIVAYKDLGESLDPNAVEYRRPWMVEQVNSGKTFCCINRNQTGTWSVGGAVGYNGSIFNWYKVPENIQRRKTFVSFYHRDDQKQREKFANLFDDLIVCKSVEDGDIDSDNSDGYIKQLIQNGHLSDTTVLVVLIGPNTKHRMHIDWEISGALDIRVGDCHSGILGLLLPSHPDYGTTHATYNEMPARLADNFKSGYAIVRDWTDDRKLMQSYIEAAFLRRSTHAEHRNNSRLQMTKNTNE